MQKFKVRLTNVPTDAPLVCSSTNSSLNRSESDSEMNNLKNGKLALNNLEVDQLQHKGGQGLRVPVTAYVLNKRGKPLMPCSARKARMLIKKGEAKAVKNYPFVIQLTRATGEQVQDCFLGIDSGYKNVGFSVITEKKEIVAGTLILDQKTSERLTERKMYRRNRRNRLWHRKPRFNNRKKPEGWLPPSTQRRFDTHIILINRLKKLLPIKNVVVEVGNFDIQKIENPDITGIQYQQGSLFEYQNMRSFLMSREHGKCQLCGKEFSKDNGSHIHHIISRKDGGTNREKNLALLHEKCHKKLHKNKLYDVLKKNKDYKDATFMNIIRKKFREILSDCKLVYGNETFVKRNILRLEKTHYNDAFVIAGGNEQKKVAPIMLKQKHRNSRVLQVNRKGFKPSIRRRRYSIQPGDFVFVKDKKYVVNGCHAYGRSVICTDGVNKFDFGIKRIEKIFYNRSIFVMIADEQLAKTLDDYK